MAKTIENPLTEYRGIDGLLTLHDRAAVDGLAALLGEVCDWRGEGKNVSFSGSFARGTTDDGSPIEVWRIFEVSLDTLNAAGQVTAGASYMRVTAAAVGNLAACEDYLYEFHTKPVRPDGWTSNIDNKAEAEDRLRGIWSSEEG